MLTKVPFNWPESPAYFPALALTVTLTCDPMTTGVKTTESRELLGSIACSLLDMRFDVCLALGFCVREHFPPKPLVGLGGCDASQGGTQVKEQVAPSLDSYSLGWRGLLMCGRRWDSPA